MRPTHVYEIRPSKDHRGVDLIFDVLPFGRLWYGEPDAISDAMGYAKFYSRSDDAVIRIYDEAGNVIETHGHTGDFKDCGCVRHLPTQRGGIGRRARLRITKSSLLND